MPNRPASSDAAGADPTGAAAAGSGGAGSGAGGVVAPPPGTGRSIIVWGWVSNAIFAVTAVPAAFASSDAWDAVAIAVALLLFAIAIGTCLYAFGKGLARSTHGDDVAVSNLFFLQGSTPKPVQRQFLWMFLVCLAITAVTASGEPFSVLVPMLPVGLAGTWAARHGVFPPRPAAAPRRR